MMKSLNFFLLSLFPLLASAHHGDAGRFNDDNTELHGTVVVLQLINPHSVVLIKLWLRTVFYKLGKWSPTN